MTPEEHKARHDQLRRALDELVADWITHDPRMPRPSTSTIGDLIAWSHRQTLEPDHGPESEART